jgi:FlaA1/EpsC-like NDP-sugar epimerase
MAAPLPTSRGSLRVKWSVFDIAWAALSPYVALAIRDAYILSADGIQTVSIYWLITFAFSLFAFAAFRLRDGMAYYFSVHDAVEIAKAVLVAELLTCLVLFTVTRLDGIPRSTPIIHALVLSLGLVAFNDPLPRRTAAQRAFGPSRMMPRGKEHAAPSAARF